MKKGFMTTISIMILALVIVNIAQGQFASANLPASREIDPIIRNGFSHRYRNNVSIRAIRNFMENFESVSNENWFNAEDRFVLTFKLDDVDYRIDYDKQGNWIQTIRTYSQAKLPLGIRDMVRSFYGNYDAFLVQEVRMPLHPVNYFIHLNGEGRIINIRIFNEEIEELQNFERSK